MNSIVRVTKAGGVTIPSYFRRREGIHHGDVFNLDVRGGVLTLTPYLNECVFCGKTKNLIEYKGKYICLECQKGVKK